MNSNNIINIEDLHNIGESISIINTKLETIENTLLVNTSNKHNFKDLKLLINKSSRFTYWDYKANHGFNNLLKQIDILVNIVKIQDYQIKDKTRSITDLNNRIYVLEQHLPNNLNN
tara:strand:- start:188 stop:535 length:348 start_codon:yes stop_codon:yes gene_type:complete